MLVRGGKLTRWIVRPETDPLWSMADWGRAAALEARWAAHGVSEDERRKLLPCAIWRAKWPETRFSVGIEARLEELRKQVI